MLLLAGFWILTLAAAIPTGLAILRIAGDEAFDRRGDRVVLAAWLGSLFLANLLLAFAFVLPLGPAAGVVIAGAVGGLALCGRGTRTEIASMLRDLSRKTVIAAGVFVLAMAWFTAQPVVWTDTGLYHAGAMRWLSEFGAVEGIGLIHFRFGFISSWLALGAPFTAGDVGASSFAVLGGFALGLASLHALVCLRRTLSGNARASDWVIVLGSVFLIPVLASQRMHVSANPDLPVAVLVLLCGWAMFATARSRAGAVGDIGGQARYVTPSLVPLLLALGAFTIKLQAAPMLIVAAAFYLFDGGLRPRRPGWRRAGLVGGLVIVSMAPWVGYAFTTTGCPAYPTPVCADVPWSVGSEAAADAADGVRNWARWRADESLGGTVDWVDEWVVRDVRLPFVALGVAGAVLIASAFVAWRSRAGPRSHKFSGFAAIAGVVAVYLFGLSAQNLLMAVLVAVALLPGPGRTRGGGWLLALGLAGYAFLLVTAPDPRFGFGYMAVLLARIGVWQWPRFASWARAALPGRVVPAVGLATLLVVAGGVAVAFRVARPTTDRTAALEGSSLVKPQPSSATALRRVEQNGIEYNVPPDGICWGADLPCTQESMIRYDVVLRKTEEGLSGGFRSTADGSP
jgi:hypothetical protein